MKVLFIHPNFPGQFRHIANHLAANPENTVVGLGDAHQVVRQKHMTRSVKLCGYQVSRQAAPQTHHYLQVIENNVLRGQAALRSCLDLKKGGFVPDLICGHAGWGDLLYVREAFPEARIIGYLEYYFHAQGADIGFDPEFPHTLDNRCEVTTKNMTQLLTWQHCDHGWSPTRWQASLYPESMHPRIAVIHEGVDCQRLAPNADAAFVLPDGRSLRRTDQVITLVNRNMEPYRGFHVFMRALPEIQRRSPQAHTVIIGDDHDVSYGNRPANGQSWRECLLAEVGEQLDLTRVHFVGQLDYPRYLAALQISSAHIYMTYPYILSWSMIEAMACGCLVIGSKTPPVQEVIRHGENGLLFDFFDQQALAEQVCNALARPDEHQPLRAAAHATAQRDYDLATVCLPRQKQMLEAVCQAARPLVAFTTRQ